MNAAPPNKIPVPSPLVVTAGAATAAPQSGALVVYFCEQCHMPMLIVDGGWLVLLGAELRPLCRERLLGPPVKVMTCINCAFPNCWHSITASPSDIYRGVREARAEAVRIGWQGLAAGVRCYPRPSIITGRGLAQRIKVEDLQIYHSPCIIGSSSRG